MGNLERINLGTYYFAGGAQNWNWTSPQNDALWRDDIKTLFDPCPPGWRVPKSGVGNLSPWNDFGTDPYAAPFFYYINGVRQTAPGVPVFALSPNNGRRYDRGNGSATAWYPTSGFRDSNAGAMRYVADGGYSWSSTVSGANSLFLDFHSMYLNPGNTAFRANSLSVRCLRE